MSNYYRGFEAVIGLEIHAQLKTNSKIFCSDATNFDAGDNENTSPVSLGMPGSLPVLNKKVVEYAIKTGLALGCEIGEKSIFARKNYFYPDLPKGYQISQYDKPICLSGEVIIKIGETEKVIKIERAHLEEDAGKSTHFSDQSLINYNRSGIPLLEIVSGPDMRSPQEAAEYARTIRQILKYLDVCDGNLEEGSLRCDCNISVRKVGDTKLGTKVEIKNINSFRFIEKALEYEIERQIDAVERAEKIIQETRLFDPDKNRTYTMRIKEDAEDYRYFPDPDLLPLILNKNQINSIKTTLPELPLQREKRFVSQYGLPVYDSAVLTSEKELADYFEETAKMSKNPKSASNWIMVEVMRELKSAGGDILKAPISAQALAELILLIDEGSISGKIAKNVFSEMWKTKKKAQQIVTEQGLGQITDSSAIEKIIDGIIQDNPSQVAEFRSGKTKVLGYFVGAAMKATKGQASPELVNKILNQKLKG